MTEPRPIDTAAGTEPEQATGPDPIGSIEPPKATRFGVRALALAGFAAAAGIVAGAPDTPTPSGTVTLG